MPCCARSSGIQSSSISSIRHHPELPRPGSDEANWMPPSHPLGRRFSQYLGELADIVVVRRTNRGDFVGAATSQKCGTPSSKFRRVRNPG